MHVIRRVFQLLAVRLALAGALVLAIGIASTAAILLSQAEGETIREREQIELAAVARSTVELSQKIDDLQLALEVAAKQIKKTDVVDAEALQVFLESQAVLRSLFNSVFVSDDVGDMRIFHDNNGYNKKQLNIKDRAYFKRTIAEKIPIISATLTSKLTGEPVVILTVPLMANGEVFGVLGGGIRSQRPNMLGAMSAATPGDSGLVVVVTDFAGQILAHPNRSLIGKQATDEPRLTDAFSRWLVEGSPADSGRLAMHDAQRLTVTSQVAEPQWMVWRVRDLKDVLAPLATGRIRATQWAVFSITTLVIVLSAWLWWQILPLSWLEERADHLFDGSMDPEAGWPDATGEVGRLERVLRRVSTERAVLEASNAKVMKRLQLVMGAAPVGIAFTHDEQFELVSAEFCRLFNRVESHLLGQPMRQMFISESDFSKFLPELHSVFDTGDHYSGEWLMSRVGSEFFWGRLSGRPIDRSQRDTGIIWSVVDITAEVVSRQALEWSATHDPLTGLTNRKGFEQRLARVFPAMPRSLPAALIMFDLDHFKPINDLHGHSAGDAMLKAVAQTVVNSLRASDLLVRLGGDEFVVVLERCPHKAAMAAAEKVRAAIAGLELNWNNHLLSVGSSLGVASLSAEMTTTATWIEAADRACYAAKAAGRNRVCFAGPEVPETPPENSV